MYVLGSREGFSTHLPEQEAAQRTGAELAANALSYAGIILPSVTGWAAVAADFNSRLPTNTPAWRIILLTWVGLMIPLMLVEVLGVCLMSVPKYYEAFQAGDVSGVIHEGE
jgi:purine-cytosine permease-like protein